MLFDSMMKSKATLKLPLKLNLRGTLGHKLHRTFDPEFIKLYNRMRNKIQENEEK